MRRLARWFRYRRRLARYIGVYHDAGYSVSPAVYRQLRDQARQEDA